MRIFAAMLVLVGLPSASRACSVCFGEPGQQASDAASMSILFLLGMVAVVLSGVFAGVVGIVRHHRRYRREQQEGGGT